MTETIELRRFRTLAKRYARANRIAQHQALDLIARELDFPNWVDLVSASKKGWRASSEQVTSIEAFATRSLPTGTLLQGHPEALSRRFADLEQAEHGMIGGHAYRLQEVLHEVIMAGEGWSIRVPENPSADPIVETYTDQEGGCPVLDPDFLKTALLLAKERADQVRAGISTDWPRRSTKPDLNGVVRHPLGGAESDVWFCLHCDGKITGPQLAQNLWHCPACGASPLDIFETAFWADDEGRSFAPVKSIDSVEQEEPGFRVVDGRPKLDLDENKITLLMRSALLDDAANISERLGALLADISLDDDGDAWIALDVDLWPEDKDPIQALTLAGILGIEVELESTAFTTPFAWPGLGEMTTSTHEYMRMVLDAYAQHGSVPEKKSKGRLVRPPL